MNFPCLWRLSLLIGSALMHAWGVEPPPTLSVPQLSVDPLIDGHCSEAEWSGAARLTLASGPLGSSAPVPMPTTTLRIAWRPETLFLAFDCDDTMLIATPEREHDGTLYDEDVAEVFIDAVGDGRAYWEIQASPFARTTDGLHLVTGEPQYQEDGRFTADFYRREHFWSTGFELDGLRVAATRRSGGWSLELAIPAMPLLRRTGAASFAAGTVIRLNALRYDWSQPRTTADRPLQQVSWSAVTLGCPHQSPSRMGFIRLAP